MTQLRDDVAFLWGRLATCAPVVYRRFGRVANPPQLTKLPHNRAQGGALLENGRGAGNLALGSPLGTPFRRPLGHERVLALAEGRLKAGCSQDWLPHREAQGGASGHYRAPCCFRMAATSGKPFFSAAASGVTPALVLALTSAPRATSSSTIAVRPHAAAR